MKKVVSGVYVDSREKYAQVDDETTGVFVKRTFVSSLSSFKTLEPSIDPPVGLRCPILGMACLPLSLYAAAYVFPLCVCVSLSIHLYIL